MKSKFIVFLLCIATLVFVLCGCSEGPSINSLDAPDIVVVGNTIVWNAIKDAESYAVYCNGKQISTTTETHYTSFDNSEDMQFSVKALHSNDRKNSAESRKVVIYKQTGFDDNEKMYLNLSSGGYAIPSNIKYVKITGSSSSANIVIADRTTDLFIELNNVTMTSTMGKSCISTMNDEYDSSLKHFAVTINVVGTNVLTGSNYTAVPSQPAVNSEQKGKNGVDGGSGLILPLISFTGDGHLTLVGGNGGKGGTGAASEGLSSSVYGNGGNGGNGGCGIKTTKAVMTMGLTGVVKAFGGYGGEKGAPGGNGSILSGPLFTGNWSNCYGNPGTDGCSLIGDMYMFSGIYMDV